MLSFRNHGDRAISSPTVVCDTFAFFTFALFAMTVGCAPGLVFFIPFFFFLLEEVFWLVELAAAITVLLGVAWAEARLLSILGTLISQYNLVAMWVNNFLNSTHLFFGLTFEPAFL